MLARVKVRRFQAGETGRTTLRLHAAACFLILLVAGCAHQVKERANQLAAFRCAEEAERAAGQAGGSLPTPKPGRAVSREVLSISLYGSVKTMAEFHVQLDCIEQYVRDRDGSLPRPTLTLP